MAEPRRLRGHKAAATYCIASRTRPGLIATAAEGKASKPLESYNYNKDEINQIVCTPNSSFLAAADDSGDVKVIDIRQQCLYRTLRAGHTSVSFCYNENAA
nr:WD repeat-containing protein 53 [Ipomoea batatas]